MTAQAAPSSFVERWAGGDPPPGVLFPEAAFDLRGAIQRRAAHPPNPLTAAELDAWRAWLAAHGAGEPVLSNAGLLGNESALCVVTGQQAGFALGPMYVLAKALGAVHLAREVAASTGRPCVPVFWVASDDHDIPEAASTSWRRHDGTLAHDTVAVGRTAAPVHDVEIPPGEIGRLAEAMAPGDALFLATLRESATPALGRPATLESSFVRLLLALLGDLGVVPVAPRLPFLRARQTTLLAREVALRGESSRLLAAMRGRLLREFGVDSIHRSGDEVNFFIEDGPPGAITRQRLRWEGDTLRVGDSGVLSMAEFEGLLAREPERFSPNAALRPIVQDHALPTVAYVGGPSEVVYHAQIGPLYLLFGVVRPAVVPRPSIAHVDARMRRDAAKLGLDAGVLAAMPLHALGEALSKGTRSDVGGEALGPRLLAATEAWEAMLGPERNDTAVAQGLAKLRENIAFLAAKAEERAAAARARRHETLEAAARRITEALHPGGQPQERVQNLLLQWHLSGRGAWVRSVDESLSPRTTTTQQVG